MDKLRRVSPGGVQATIPELVNKDVQGQFHEASRSQGYGQVNAAKKPGNRCQGDGDVQLGQDQVQEVQQSQDGDGQLSPEDVQEGDQQLVAREGQGDVQQDVQQGDGDGLSTQCQGYVRQGGGGHKYE